MKRERKKSWTGLAAASTACLVLVFLSGCAGGSSDATGVSYIGNGSVGGGSPSSNGGGGSSSLSFAVGADPSIPTFTGAAADQSLISTALANAGMSLTPPKGNTPIYVAPPTNYTPAGVNQIGAGTQSDPYQNLIAVVNAAVPGDRIYLEPGVYLMYSMAQKFGEAMSELAPSNSGTAADPIVITTDPQALNWSSQQVATIDFQLQDADGTYRHGAIFPKDYWVIENLDIKDALDRIIWLAGSHDLIYHNDLHHVEFTGEDNVGIVDLMRLTGGDYNDFVIGNNIHDAGVYDASGNITAYSPSGAVSINEGCTYNETDQYYVTAANLANVTNANSLSISQLAIYTAPPDTNVYFYGNAVHDCEQGISTKIPEVGSWYVLSNVIYNVQLGVRMTLSGSVIRNNIIYNSGPQQLETGIEIGVEFENFFLTNGDNLTITRNTIINAASEATLHYGGFNDVIDNNVFVTTGSAVAHRIPASGYGTGTDNGGVNTNGQTWYNGGVWPGAMGEYLFDVNASNPYYASMPDFLQEEAGSYRAMSFNDNLYTSTPTVTFSSAPLVGPNLSGTNIDQNAQVLSWSSLAPLFRNAASDDYRAGASPGVLATIGSQIQ